MPTGQHVLKNVIFHLRVSEAIGMEVIIIRYSVGRENQFIYTLFFI